MSLVAYGNSDSEEEVEDQDESVSSSTVSSTIKTMRNDSEEKVDVAEESVSSSTVFAPKKQRETVRITIPSLDQFKDEEKDSEPPKKPTYKSGSGLFSMLPPPKYSGSAVTHNFKPHVLTKKIEPSKNSTPKATNQVTVHQVTTSSISSSTLDPDSTNNTLVDEASPKFDFFSLDSPNAILESEGNDPLVNETHSKSTLFSSLPNPVQSYCTYAPPEQSVLPSASSYESAGAAVQDGTESCYSHTSEASNGQSFLNDKEFLKIKGKRGRDEIQIIDVHGSDQLTGKDEWLMQSLTEEKVERPSKRRNGMPTQQQKRKHQITYLAFQAKERELDLKNQWSMNSLTRRETQAKYGF